jgi:hypothetical protein
MSEVRLGSILVGGSADPWVTAGFAVDVYGRIPFVNGDLQFTDAGHGLTGLAVEGLDELSADIDGIPVGGGTTTPPIDHPNGAFELDHVVIMTDSLDRTSAAVEHVLGLERRRVRETAEVRQAFHRFADRGCIIEIVERPGLDQVGLWGLVVNVIDLDAAVELLGPDLIGAAKLAVQPGRRIATVRSGSGLGVAVAFMTPHE